MKTVWVIDSGEYSDYHVDYLCSTKEIADLLAKRLNDKNRYMEARVSEWDIIESLDEIQERQYWRAAVDKDGNVLPIDKDGNTMPKLDPEMMMVGDVPEPRVFTHTTTRGKIVIDGADAFSDRGYEVALKAARDKLYQAKAELLS